MSSYKDEELDNYAPSAAEQIQQDAMRALGLDVLSDDEITDEVHATVHDLTKQTR